jgi:hypothetical protein
VDALGKRVDVAGVLIESFELTDLAYASEIAQSMLVRQQAEAKLDARKIIVEGAVDIAVNALEGLQKRGTDFFFFVHSQDTLELTGRFCIENLSNYVFFYSIKTCSKIKINHRLGTTEAQETKNIF